MKENDEQTQIPTEETLKPFENYKMSKEQEKWKKIKRKLIFHDLTKKMLKR